MVTQPTIQLANLGMVDSLILMVMALVVFGPRRLPQIGRQVGKLMYEFRKASNDFKFQMEEEFRLAEEADRRKAEEEKSRDQVPALAIGVDSQVTESRPGAPSPYSGEGVYPDVSPAEFQHDEPYPRIQPPATGEPVQAARPGSVAAQVELQPASTGEDGQVSHTMVETAPVLEQARHA